MQNDYSNLSIVIPAYNESHKVLEQLRSDLEYLGAEVIVVDDGSSEPVPSAIKHGVNFGYGSALMTGIKNATRPVIMTIDGDGQHAVDEVKKLWAAWNLMDGVDMLIGVRRIRGERLVRLLGRKFLNWTASLLCLYYLPDLNSGARVFRRDKAIGYFPILCRTFSFTTSITMSFMCDGYHVEWFPIKVHQRAHGKSHVRVIRHGLVTLYYILRIGIALRTRGLRQWKRNLFSRLIGNAGSMLSFPAKSGRASSSAS